jgi:hypothetical protein
MKLTKFSFFRFSRFSLLAASVSVRNLRNIPLVPLTVKPDPHDTLNQHLNGSDSRKYENSVEMIYSQQQKQARQDPLQHQYAVIKKTRSKRDICDNLERENSAFFKVNPESSLNAR